MIELHTIPHTRTNSRDTSPAKELSKEAKANKTRPRGFGHLLPDDFLLDIPSVLSLAFSVVTTCPICNISWLTDSGTACKKMGPAITEWEDVNPNLSTGKRNRIFFQDHLPSVLSWARPTFSLLTCCPNSCNISPADSGTA